MKYLRNKIAQFKQWILSIVMPSTFPKPIWSEGEFEIYHKHSIYYTCWCKEHLCSYDITIEPDRHSYIKMNYAIWFEHPWEGINKAVKKHYATIDD